MLTLPTLLIACVVSYASGRLFNPHARRATQANLCRKLQLIALRNEIQGLRRKGKRPVLQNHQKWLLGLLHRVSPTLTRYSSFRPETLIGWHRRYVKRYWWLISHGHQKPLGRPRLDPAVESIILDIKHHNPTYGARRIASMVTEQLGVPVSEGTVRNVLKRGPKPASPVTPPGQTWKTFLSNHRHSMASMDFKVSFDWRGRPLHILSIIDHHRRKLIHCRSTYHPGEGWVAQQMREAFPFDQAPAMLLIDNDSTFLPAAQKTLPAMGIQVVRTALRCPQQNGIVERFNRTLTEELLDHIIPLSAKHLNARLAEFQDFYNTARPHRANGGQAPDHTPAANESLISSSVARGTLRAHAIPWLNGLHHSYRRAA